MVDKRNDAPAQRCIQGQCWTCEPSAAVSRMLKAENYSKKYVKKIWQNRSSAHTVFAQQRDKRLLSLCCCIRLGKQWKLTGVANYKDGSFCWLLNIAIFRRHTNRYLYNGVHVYNVTHLQRNSGCLLGKY